MDDQATPIDNAAVSREIQRFSMQALELAKKVVDGTISPDDRETAQALATELPTMAAKMRTLDAAYRPGASSVLSEARLDLAYVAAGGGIPSSIRLGRYITEQEQSAGS